MSHPWGWRRRVWLPLLPFLTLSATPFSLWRGDGEGNVGDGRHGGGVGTREKHGPRWLRHIGPPTLAVLGRSGATREDKDGRPCTRRTAPSPPPRVSPPSAVPPSVRVTWTHGAAAGTTSVVAPLVAGAVTSHPLGHTGGEGGTPPLSQPPSRLPAAPPWTAQTPTATAARWERSYTDLVVHRASLPKSAKSD